MGDLDPATKQRAEALALAACRELAAVAAAWAVQRAERWVSGRVTGWAVVEYRSARWGRTEATVVLDTTYGVDVLRPESVERAGPFVLVRERWHDGPSLLYVLRADREVTSPVAASMLREAGRW